MSSKIHGDSSDVKKYISQEISSIFNQKSLYVDLILATFDGIINYFEGFFV